MSNNGFLERRSYRLLVYTVIAVAGFFGFWKIDGMPPGYRGDYLDLFDDIVVLSGLVPTVLLFITISIIKRKPRSCPPN